MQFSPDFEKVIRNPMKLREYPIERRKELIAQLKGMRSSWHYYRSLCGDEFPKSVQFVKKHWSEYETKP